MSPSGTAAKATHLVMACTRCGRRGKGNLPRLVARLGPNFAMTDLGAELADCPNRAESSHAERCDVYFPGLVAVFQED